MFAATWFFIWSASRANKPVAARQSTAAKPLMLDTTYDTPLSSAATAIANMKNNPSMGAETAPDAFPIRERRHAGECILKGEARM